MHELTLCYQTHEMILEHAKKAHAKKIVSVWMEVGALSCVELESLRFCFDLVCKESIAEGCTLYLEQQTATAWCEHCKETVPVKNIFITTCSLCDQTLTHVEADDKVWVKKIQVE